jgi:hypothetical protein
MALRIQVRHRHLGKARCHFSYLARNTKGHPHFEVVNTIWPFLPTSARQSIAFRIVFSVSVKRLRNLVARIYWRLSHRFP